MIERAELPVQTTSTRSGRSLATKSRRAGIDTASAAHPAGLSLQQASERKASRASARGGLRSEDDVAAFPPRCQQADLFQRSQMGRQRIMGHRQQSPDVSGGETMRAVAHQQAKDLQPRRLRQRAEQRDRVGRIEPRYVGSWRHAASSLLPMSFPIASSRCCSAMPCSVASGKLEKIEMRLLSMR